MRFLSLIAVFAFVAGAALLVAGVALRDTPEPPRRSNPFDLRTATPVTTAALETTTPAAAAATPTLTPFDGKVARIVSDAIGLDHAVEEVGLVDNQLDVPKDGVNKVGWYSIYDQPGHGGNAVFAAHVNFDRKQGPFARLASVTSDAQFTVVMDGGPSYVYQVLVYARYDVDTMPTGDIIAARDKPDAEEWITLITCGGDFVANPGSDFGHYEGRDVVIARRIR